MKSYFESGVDIKRGDELVDRIKNKVKSTYGDRVEAGVGGFAGLYRISDDKLLSVGTDGVGTKLKLALELDKHDTIGQDLVAMCVNDILCTGATPLFFLDYLATDKISPQRDESLVEGIANACKECQMALIGGETAEMPGLYPKGTYDLAGFSVGEVLREELFDYSLLKEGDTIVGLSSSGLHSNGYSLARKLIEKEDQELKLHALEPTRLYPSLILPILKSHKGLIKGMAHITGGGLLNIARLSKNFNYYVDEIPLTSRNEKIFNFINENSAIDPLELHRTFNMGVGLSIVTNEPLKLLSLFNSFGEKAFVMGELKKGKGEVLYKGKSLE